MAFNVGNFIKSSAKSVGNRILDSVVTSVTSQLSQSLVSSARSTTDTLFNVGASFDSISAFAAKRTDSIVNQKAEMYYALAGKDPARIAGADLKRLRTRASEDVNEFISDINPSTKVASRKRDASMILDAVV